MMLGGCSQEQPPSAAPPVKPLHIVSMSPCIDAILKEIADPAQIAAISHYSQDPRATSVDIKWAKRFKALSYNVEEVIAENPDLVIATEPVPVQTSAALNRAGIPLVSLAIPTSIEQSKGQITRLAQTIGRPDQAAILNAKIDVAVMRARPAPGPAMSALIWSGGGLVPGEGTLADEMLAVAGYRNSSAEYGLQQWGILPLEPILASPPDTIFSALQDGDRDRILSHPVMHAASRHIRMAYYPGWMLNCGGPTIIAALDQLSAAQRSEGTR